MKRYLRLLAVFAIALIVAVVLKGCPAGRNQALKTLRIGTNSWPGYAIALYAQAAGLFQQRGLNVELVNFNNQQDNIRATLRGSLDASFVPLWEVMQADAGEESPAIVLVTDISAGSDGIVARSGINSVADLRDRQVGVKLGTVPHLVLLEALLANQIEPDDVNLKDVSNDRSLQQLKAGTLDAAVVWEPALSQTAKAIDSKVIFTTQDVDSLVIDSLATRTSFAKDRQAEFTQFILAWFDTIQAIETDSDRVFAVIGRQLKRSSQDFAADYAGLKKGDRAMNQRMFEGGRLAEAIAQISKLLAADPRHKRAIRQDLEIVPAPLVAAMRDSQP